MLCVILMSHVTLNDGQFVNNELGRTQNEVIIVELGYHHGICIEGLEKTCKPHSE
jgi:hypothetical protein